MVKAIVGANWGDEGKGKITDVLAANSDMVIRFQGGSNAGHTIINNYGRFALHQLPSGVFYDNITNIIGNGVALNVDNFINELKSLEEQGVKNVHILVSDRAQIVMPYHILFDCYEEERLSKESFGSTKSGIAPFYSDKFAKIGFQVNELYDDTDSLRKKLERILEVKNLTIKNLYHKEELSVDEIFNKLMEYKEMLEPYVASTFDIVNDAVKAGKNILLEGQLGTLKDTDFGIYPMVTSSNTIAGYGAVGAGGIPPYEIKEIVTVVKAYSSSVGAGEFVSEIHDEEEAEELRKRGGDKGEYGATTGRPRRVGWLDLVMVVRFRVQHRLLSQLLTLLVILMRFLLLLLMSLTAKELITSHQQQSLRDASLLLRFFLAGSAIFVELRNMISFLKIAESISNLLRRQSVFLSR